MADLPMEEPTSPQLGPVRLVSICAHHVTLATLLLLTDHILLLQPRKGQASQSTYILLPCHQRSQVMPSVL